MARHRTFKLEDLDPEQQAFVKNQLSVSTPNVEPCTRNEAARANAAEAFDAPVSIHIHSLRNRPADADGLCAKWIIDSLVEVGLLADDSPRQVKSVTFSQEQIGADRVEETILTIHGTDNT